MDAKRILKYLRQLSANNNRPWFQDHKPEYEAIRADFERGVQQALERIVTFDNSVAHLTVKDCTYRFYRDTRFSNDKSPYKNHLGAYISAHGKKSLHGGYYIHLEPGHCLLAIGLPKYFRNSGLWTHRSHSSVLPMISLRHEVRMLVGSQ